MHIDDIAMNFFLEREIFWTKVVGIEHIFCVQYIFSESRAVYEIMWKKYIVEPDRAQMKI